MDELRYMYINEITKETYGYLTEILPSLGVDDWWNDLVVEKLSYQQQRQVETRDIKKLENLDLAALMRVFSKNWYQIADKMALPYEGLNLVKEVHNIRNRNSHEGIEERPLDDVYRDLDTLKRYMDMIGTNEVLAAKIDDQRNKVLTVIAGKEIGLNEASPQDTSSVTTDEKPIRGVNFDLFHRESGITDEIRKMLEEKTFIGIDFGTSTTVVSFLKYDEERKNLIAEPIPIKQFDELGRCEENHLVATCIAWTGQQLLIGQGAAQLKSTYELGKNIWFSFKMQLGAQSVIYFRSDLSEGKGPVEIENPRQAAIVFFRYLLEQIEGYIKEKNLPEQTVYSVSVPASFEANQRNDLCTAIQDAGMELPVYGIIDEPNAAFISYLIEMFRSGTEFAKSMENKKRRILIFDFGAGTCDISILEVGKEKDLFTSRNLSISQFHVLGGDNIDRQIVREALLNQLIDQMNTEENFTTTELKESIIPKLQPIAEGLKVQICKYITNNWDGKNISPFAESDRIVTSQDVEPFNMRDGIKLVLEKPNLSFVDFSTIMEPFVSSDESDWSHAHRKEDIVSVFEPVLRAIKKAGIDESDLDMILFIGGSSLNPFVQSAIQEYFGRFVEPVVLRDLRTPVSKGAAFNSFIVNGLNSEIIKPITSETIYVLTVNGGLRKLLSAGTEIPSKEFLLDDLEVQSDGQSKLELPICVTSEDKILQVLEVLPSKEQPFLKGELISLTCCMDENKLLQVKAKVGDRNISVTQLNPLANKELTPEDAKILEARHIIHTDMLKNSGRPTVDAMLYYAYACRQAKRYVEAAEAFEAVERLDPDRDFSTTICYLYAMGNKPQLSSKWAYIAYERYPSAIVAFNLALTKKDEDDIEAFETLMEESLKHDPEYGPALYAYGDYLRNKDSIRSLAMIERAYKVFKEQFDHDVLDEDDFFRLRRAAQTLGRADVVKRVDDREKELRFDDRKFSDKYLAKSNKVDRERKRRE